MTTSHGTSAAQRIRLRDELRHFLQTRRARLTPEEVGLPSGGRRRTPGLRREEVAVLAGVGASWYTWLEQGRDIKVSDSVLDAVSRALRLDEHERAYLYRLAGVSPPQPSAVAEAEVTPELERLVDGWLPNPAYVIGKHWNVLVMNQAARAAFGFTSADRNCLVSFFTNEKYRARFRYWEETAPTLVAEFRRDAARYPDDPEFHLLADELRSRSTEFAALWARHDVRSEARGTKAIEHPTVGCLVFEHATLHLPDSPHTRLILHTPLAGTDTRAKLERLVEREARRNAISLVEAG
ncbi:helix-turn-helix transcriptional regulator [Gandjariella thermophila]|uniref:helix-turn-helix transcriptional regulator n=1 Tax=Gandjariella thermophila TaxID=1931992 RepID=UPI001CEF68DF|nr:helix-turn-helix transcriptional regulator [Gandjariella thermophila]